MKAMALFEESNYEESLKFFKKIVQINPKLKEGHTGVGMCLAALGKFSDSIEHFDRAIQINMSNYVANFHKGRSLVNLQKYQESIDAFDRAMQIDMTAECYSFKACSLFHLKKYEESVKLFKKAVLVDPKDPNIHRHVNLYASAYLFLQDYSECIRCVDNSSKRLMKRDQISSLIFIKGQAFYKLKSFQNAIDTLNSALDILADDDPEETLQMVASNKLLIEKIKALVEKCKKELK